MFLVAAVISMDWQGATVKDKQMSVFPGISSAKYSVKMQPSELSPVSEPHNNTLEVTDTADDDPRSSSTTFIDETLTEIREKEYKPK